MFRGARGYRPEHGLQWNADPDSNQFWHAITPANFTWSMNCRTGWFLQSFKSARRRANVNQSDQEHIQGQNRSRNQSPILRPSRLLVHLSDMDSLVKAVTLFLFSAWVTLSGITSIIGAPHPVSKLSSPPAPVKSVPMPIARDPTFATDTAHVYSDGKVAAGADPQTFDVLNSRYEKDRYYVYAYYGGREIEAGLMPVIAGADPASFTVFDPSTEPSSTALDTEIRYAWMQNYAKDNAHVYYSGHVLSGADPNTFRLLPLYYGRDSRSVFFLDRLVPGADPNSFNVTIGAKGTYVASDKYHRYFDDQVAQ